MRAGRDGVCGFSEGGGRVSLWSLAIEQNPVYEQVASAR